MYKTSSISCMIFFVENAVNGHLCPHLTCLMFCNKRLTGCELVWLPTHMHRHFVNTFSFGNLTLLLLLNTFKFNILKHLNFLFLHVYFKWHKSSPHSTFNIAIHYLIFLYCLSNLLQSVMSFWPEHWLEAYHTTLPWGWLFGSFLGSCSSLWFLVLSFFLDLIVQL